MLFCNQIIKGTVTNNGIKWEFLVAQWVKAKCCHCCSLAQELPHPLGMAKKI